MIPHRSRLGRVARRPGRRAFAATRVPRVLTTLGLLGLGPLIAWSWSAVAGTTATSDGCPVTPLPTAACSAGGATVLGALIVLTVGARASWLGVTAARDVRNLGVVPTPMALSDAARHRVDVPVSCVAGADRIAFCAGVWRPRIYLSAALVAALPDDELAAVLAHENAHARRRDPLRGLLWRACADVLFFAPVLKWGHRDRQLRGELAADRAAVARAGAPALAGALLRLAGPGSADPAPAAAPAFGPTDAAIDARIAALISAPPPPRPFPVRAAAVSVAGMLLLGVIATCLPTLIPWATG